MNVPHPTKPPKQSLNSKKTLDIQHTTHLQEFKKKKDKIAALEKKLAIVNKHIKFLEEKRKTKELTNEESDKYISYKDDRTTLTNSINDINNSRDEIEYFMNTASLLFKYYDIVEKGTTNDEPNIKVTDSSILKYFVKEPVHDTSKKESEKYNDKASLLQKYLERTDPSFVKVMENDTDKCQYCASSNLNMMHNEGMICCNDCYGVEYIIIDHDRPSYKDPPKEISYLNVFYAEYNSRLRVCFLLVFVLS